MVSLTLEMSRVWPPAVSVMVSRAGNRKWAASRARPLALRVRVSVPVLLLRTARLAEAMVTVLETSFGFTFLAASATSFLPFTCSTTVSVTR